MGGGGGKSKTQVTDYYLGAHLGVCHGPVDEVIALTVGEKRAWSGSVTSQTVTEVYIDNKGLFGGNKAEGGLYGTMYVLNGGKAQVLPEKLAAKIGGTSTTVPAYRGMLSLWFTEVGDAARKGFMWASNNAYIKSAWVTVSRWAKFRDYLDFNPSDAQLQHIRIGKDQNPAWIILEVLMNKTWGMGIPAQMIEISSFLQCAKTLFDEGFGISILWSDQTDGESFITNIVNHINGAVYTNPFSGKIEMRLLRYDYNVNEIPVLTADDCVVTSYQKKTWAETVNEVVVKYTSPDNEELASVVTHNLANINIQGGIVSQTNEYPGIRNPTLALKVANRDLRMLSTPLIGVEVEANGKLWKFKPGDVLMLNYPEYGLSGVVMRIGEINYGTVSDRTMKITMTEDVFTAGVAHYVPQQPMDTTNRDLPSKIDDVLLTSAPYGVFARYVGTDSAASVAYPNCPFMLLMSEKDNISSAETMQKQLPSSIETPVGDTLPQGKYKLLDPIGFDVYSTLSIGDRIGYNEPQVGDLMILSSKSPVDVADLTIEGGTELLKPEIVYVVSVESSSSVTVRRGCFDTLPYAWPAGTDVNIVNSAYSVIAAGSYGVVGSETSYRLYPRNNNGQLRVSDIYTVVGDERFYKPYRPANVMINETLYPLVASLPISVTWSSRNRLVETAEPLAFTASNVAAESGTEYILDVTMKIAEIGSEYTFQIPTVRTTDHSVVITADIIDATMATMPELAGKNHSDITDVAISLSSECNGYVSYESYRWKFELA